ncbi:hypothetical protein BDV06DRAFT_231266 [Aspergillus oleicola]
MTKIALFGSPGQFGQAILLAVIRQTSDSVVQVIPPDSEEEKVLYTISLNSFNSSVDDLALVLEDVEIVVNALNGKTLEAQRKIQDAADKAGTWNTKSNVNRDALHHPAISSGRKPNTLTGDFYNQDREGAWCPWTQLDVPSYKLHILGDSSAKVDFTHTDDLASYVAETIQNLGVSGNKCLNVVNDTINYDETAEVLERYFGKKVEKVTYPIKAMDWAWSGPGNVPGKSMG